MRNLRIAVGQISSESNHFAARLCEVSFFRKTGYLLEGKDVVRLADSDTEIGGILGACRAAGGDGGASVPLAAVQSRLRKRDACATMPAEIVPLLATRGNSSTVLSDKCWSVLKGRMLRRLKAAGTVDGVVLSHHGSMAVESEDDPEGDLATEIRRMVGPRTPFAMTLDLHGNVTRRMIEATNIICGYETYPHQDAHRTGRRATELLLRAIRGQIRPVMAHVKLPMILTGFHGSTLGKGPFARLMRAAKNLEVAPDVRRGTSFDASPPAPSSRRVLRGSILSTSLFFVGSYLDMPDMGCSTLVIADGDADLARRYALALAKAFWASRNEFVVESLSVAEAVKRGRRIEGGPVLLLDTADTTGGGAAGDSIALVRGLLDAGVTESCLAMVVDPPAARRCHRARPGETFRLSIGHHVDPKWGKPVTITVKLIRKTDGRFRYRGGILGGTSASMGPTAVLEIGSIRLLVMTNPTYDYAYEQYESAGLDPRKAKFVGVKNMMNFRFGYRDMMKGVFVLDCPGPTPPDMRALPFRRIQRPVFPLDKIKKPQLSVTISKP
jgi:microcystin degradation protein MlrC